MSYSHSVVGIFDNEYEARDAVDALMEKGIYRSDIDFKGGAFNADNTEAAHHSYHDEHEKESGITAFFRTIFGHDDHHEADKYSRIATKAGAIVTVYVYNEDEAKRVARVLDEKGAIDVNDRDGFYPDSHRQHPLSHQGDTYDTSVLSRTPDDAIKAQNLDRQTDEDFEQRPRIEERSGPGVGAQPTGGMQSKSRINKWAGEASARLREDRDSETKLGW